MSDAPETGTALAKPIDTVRAALERLKPQLALALPKHLSPDRLVRVAMTALQRTPKLLDCDRTSFYGAVMTAAQLGLEPDGILGQGWIIPYGKNAQFIPGYKGLITLARNSGEISYIGAHEVRQRDVFEFDFGSGDPPRHTYSLTEERGDVIAFYALARFKDGSFYWDMMTRAEVDLIRDGSQGYQAELRNAKKYNRDPETPWIQHYVEMGRKTAIRRIAKYLPLSVQKAVEIEAAVDAGYKVTLDRYGDIVIDGEATKAESEVQAEASSSKLDRFEERHTDSPATTQQPSEDPSTTRKDEATSGAAAPVQPSDVRQTEDGTVAGENHKTRSKPAAARPEGQNPARPADPPQGASPSRETPESGARGSGETEGKPKQQTPPRSPIWQEESYEVEREILPDNRINFVRLRDALVYLVDEAESEEELDKLLADNQQNLERLAGYNPKFFGEVDTLAQAQRSRLEGGGAR